ncbi:uncharacterized protein N0V89_009454 [Didymosphaeria variabile]|uniref:Uncharacterized protein n=1 Tax=Didymosphaeria variabile TaxID=1932322 RepID=A0A9W8XDI6_9PLEO|nr:uncharacterized protein N0V89_009454 [Didymosphaeria variabile]KAJ4348082.1 hypothetical protein N0V89_009454 [Didymosphaeria variabile]
MSDTKSSNRVDAYTDDSARSANTGMNRDGKAKGPSDVRSGFALFSSAIGELFKEVLGKTGMEPHADARKKWTPLSDAEKQPYEQIAKKYKERVRELKQNGDTFRAKDSTSLYKELVEEARRLKPPAPILAALPDEYVWSSPDGTGTIEDGDNASVPRTAATANAHEQNTDTTTADAEEATPQASHATAENGLDNLYSLEEASNPPTQASRSYQPDGAQSSKRQGSASSASDVSQVDRNISQPASNDQQSLLPRSQTSSLDTNALPYHATSHGTSSQGQQVTAAARSATNTSVGQGVGQRQSPRKSHRKKKKH